VNGATTTTTTTKTTTSVTRQARTNRSVTTQQGTAASTQPPIAPFVTSRGGKSTSGATRNDQLSVLITSKSPSTLDQNADGRHQSWVMIAGNRVSLQCHSAFATRFFWSYCPVGSRKWTMIYNGHRITSNLHLATKVSVSDCDVRSCTFNVDYIHVDDAGFFICMRSTVENYWTITILGEYVRNYLAIWLSLAFPCPQFAVIVAGVASYPPMAGLPIGWTALVGRLPLPVGSLCPLMSPFSWGSGCE